MPRPLKEIRREKGKTQQDMGDLMGISKFHYCNLENGKRRLKYIDAVKISEILGVALQDIFFAEQDAKITTDKGA